MEQFEKIKTREIIKNLAQETAKKEYDAFRQEEGKLVGENTVFSPFSEDTYKQEIWVKNPHEKNHQEKGFIKDEQEIIIGITYPKEETNKLYSVMEYFNVWDNERKKYINVKIELEWIKNGIRDEPKPSSLWKIDPLTNQVLEFNDESGLGALRESPDYLLRKSAAESHPISIKDALELAKNLPAQIPFRRQPPKNAKK